MSAEQQHLSVFHDPNVESLAIALQKFEALFDETPSRKSRIRAAVATVGRLLHLPPDEIPAQAAFLMRRLGHLKHRPTGLAPKSLANCKTELRHLVGRLYGRGRRSHLRAPSPEWLALRDALPDERWGWKLSRFMALASAAGITPKQVDGTFVATFRKAIHESGEVPKPEQHVRQAMHTWNRLTEAHPELELKSLTIPARRRPGWTIEPARFPISFQQEVDGWIEHLSKVDPEGEDGRVRALRPASLKLHRHTLYKAASALVFAGRPIDEVTSLACLVEMDAFKIVMKFLRERQGGQPSTALLGVAHVLKAVARHHIKVGDAELNRMKKICANYQVDDAGRSKSRDRLVNFEDDRLLGALVHLPARLLDEAESPKTPKTRKRLLAQVAVAIEIELHAPVRLANLVSINLERHVQEIRIRGERRWIVRFDRHETKNRSLLTYELPDASVREIDRALTIYRPTNGWLFPGTGKSGHKLASTFGRQIKLEVERRLGVPFNVHLFRGLVATTQVRESENGFEVARAMLGDRNDRVVRNHYTYAAERHLIAKGQGTMQRVRMRTAPLAPRRA
jgi:integrase